MMSIILTTYLFIKSNIFLLSFLLGMVGEEFVLFLAILAGNGEMPLISVIIGGVLGMLFIGQIYFFIGRSKFISQLDKNGSISKMTHFLPQFIKKFGETSKKVNSLIDQYDFGQALLELYEFFWHEFCDKYLEEIKNQRKNLLNLNISKIIKEQLKSM